MSRRPHRDYTARAALPATFAGIDVTTPAAGFYRFRMHAGAVRGVVKVFFGPPNDPVTGEVLDRSWRWQALLNGELIDFDRVWPACAKDPVSEDDYRSACRRLEWARQNAPGSAYADPTARHDPLSASAPLPF